MFCHTLSYSCHVLSCSVMLCHALSCSVMLCHALSCSVMHFSNSEVAVPVLVELYHDSEYRVIVLTVNMD